MENDKEPQYRGWWLIICLPGLVITRMMSGGGDVGIVLVSSMLAVGILMGISYLSYKSRLNK